MSVPAALSGIRGLMAVAGNRTVTAALQRYRVVKTPATEPGQLTGHTATPIVAADAPAYPASKGSSRLHVSDDGKLAVQARDQPQEAFLEDSVLTTANQVLADKPVMLVEAGSALTIGGRTLKRVVPGKDGHAIERLAASECALVAREVMGLQGNKGGTEAILGRGEGASRAELLSADHPERRAARWLAHGGEGGPLDGPEPEGYGIVKDYGRALGKGKADQRAQEAGLNQYALPGVGQAYVTYSGRTARDHTSKEAHQDYAAGGVSGKVARATGGSVTRMGVWDMHWAAVVAQSGSDRVTFENYNRADELKAVRDRWYATMKDDPRLTGLQKGNPGLFLRAAIPILNPGADVEEVMNPGNTAWYFRMYGTAKGQSFHERAHAAGDTINPVTFAVAPADEVRVPGPEAEPAHE